MFKSVKKKISLHVIDKGMTTNLLIANSIMYTDNPYVLPWNVYSSLPQDPLQYYVQDRSRRLTAAVINAPFNYDPNMQGYFLVTSSDFPMWDYTKLGGVGNIVSSSRNFLGQVSNLLTNPTSYLTDPLVLQNRFMVTGTLFNVPTVIETNSTSGSVFLVVRIKIPADFGYKNDAVQYLSTNGTDLTTICNPHAYANPSVVPELLGNVGPIDLGDNVNLAAPTPYADCLQCDPLQASTCGQYFAVNGNSLWFAVPADPLSANAISMSITATVSEIPSGTAQTSQINGPQILCNNSNLH